MRFLRSLLLLCVFVGVGRAAVAPFLHPLFANHAVLQRDLPLPVWGWAAPGSAVTVQLAGESASATAGADGRWQATLAPLAAGGPYTLAVSGPSTVTRSDVMLGDVWLCSGQSNMWLPLSQTANASAEALTATHPNLRFCYTDWSIPADPLAVPANFISWQASTPSTAPWFSAVGYYFGKELLAREGVAIGLIDSSYGGTPCAGWLSTEALRTVPAYQQRMADYDSDLALWRSSFAQDTTAMIEQWFAAEDPGSVGEAWADPALSTASWTSMSLPRLWGAGGVANHDGVVWFRRSVTIPPEWAGRDLTLGLGAVNDQNVAWFDGNRLGETIVPWKASVYTVPGALVHAGTSVIAVRVYCGSSHGGFAGAAQDLSLRVDASTATSLAGTWAYRAGATAAALGRMPYRFGQDPTVPASDYNGKIAPLEPFSLKGVIWYQGESDTGEPGTYPDLLGALITDWRGRFGGRDLPFGIVQLANYLPRQAIPTESAWAGVRDAQLSVSRTVPRTGLAVTIDLGDAANIHYLDKLDVSHRLALWARATAYGEDVAFSGPLYRSMAVEGAGIRLSFDFADGGLATTDGGAPSGFAICGADRLWQWANATIDADTIVVASPSVPTPVAVRYAWADNPACNLANGAGLLASPFSTETWTQIDPTPSITIVGPSSSPTLDSPITLTLTSSTLLPDLSGADMQITNGSLVSFTRSTVDPLVFQVQIAPASSGIVVASIPASAAHDQAGTAIGATSCPVTYHTPNHAPSFVEGVDVTVPQGSTPQTRVGWATAISPGPADDAGQSTHFIVTTAQPALFTALPAIASDGTLTFTPAPNANTGSSGPVQVTVVLQDDGGTASGGVDASASQTFSITITPSPGSTATGSGSGTTAGKVGNSGGGACGLGGGLGFLGLPLGMAALRLRRRRK